YLETKAARLKVEGAKDAKRQKRLADELEWVRSGAKARQAKSKARLKRYEELASQEYQKRNETNEIYIPPGPRLGELVIEVKGLRKGFGDRLLIDDLSFTLPRNGIVGVVGPNGAGKTTLFKMIMGLEKPDGGSFKIGETVKLGYVDQNRFSATDDKKTVYDVVSGGLETLKLGNREINARAYLARFNFSGTDQQKPISVLSGGERNRVHLALTLKDAGNVLLLDEPTNDLDVNTLRALEVAMENFVGCAVIISHDRWFLDRIATHVLAFEGESQVVWFEGNFSDYEEDKKRRLGPEAEKIHRIKYKKFKR
ncbi:MAG TPA: ATP-binding cassette domain-containing protein, partial [bacterium]|nr:ATP-binding cassette domain-containing protein [bacterium]